MCAHAQLAHETGIHRTSVIKNGEMLGISPPRNGKAVGTTQGMQKLASIPLNLFYNDGNKVRLYSLQVPKLFSFCLLTYISGWTYMRKLTIMDRFLMLSDIVSLNQYAYSTSSRELDTDFDKLEDCSSIDT